MTVHVIDRQGIRVFTGKSDAEAVRWWRLEGESTDLIEDTGELLADLDVELNLDD